MTSPIPLTLLTLRGNDTHCLAIAFHAERPASRSIHPVEIVGQFRMIDDQPNLTPESFARGKDFTDLLHTTIAKHGPSVPGISQAASSQDEGYVYVIDGRTPTPQGRVPPEDIIGSFRVLNGRITSDAYARFPEHRLFTENGIVQLEPILLQHLLNELESKCAASRTDA